MKLLIKVGGTLLDEPGSREAIARQLAEVAREHHTVVVHGGGKQVTRFLEERGIQSRFVGGLRVSDEVVVGAATQVIAGTVNKQLVAALLAAGGMPLGISGLDGLLTSAVQLNPELGAVGKPTRSDGRLLDLLVSAAYLPVVACIGADRQGHIYNVNADQMAVSCAVGWRATKLLFLTDVPGVKGREGTVLQQLDRQGSEELIASGVAHGGMQAKLQAAHSALDQGVEEVLIAAGQEPDICKRLLAGEPLGTRITKVLVPEESARA
jgi:acetylglutamate kinase